MRLAHVAVGAAALAAACAPSPRSIELPTDTAARAQLVAVAQGTQTLQVRATAYGAPLRVDVGEDGRADVELLLYDRPLDALELEPGPVLPATNTPYTRSLPTPRAVYRLAIGDDERWVPAPAPSDALATMRIARAPRCAPPTRVSRIQLPDAGRTAWMVRAGPDRVETLSADGALRIISPTGIVSTTTVGVDRETFAPLYATRADDGSTWATSRTVLWRVSPGPTPRATRVTSDPRWRSLQGLAIDPADPEGEAYVAESTGTLDRLSRGTHERLFDANTNAASNIVSIVRWGRGEVTVSFSELTELVHVKGEQLIVDYPFDPREPTTYARRTGERTLLLAAQSGRVREGTLGEDGRFEWREIGQAPITVGWNAFAPTPTGFYYGAENGWVGEFRDGAFCDPPPAPLYVDRVTQIVPLDGLVAISGIGSGTRSNEVVFVRWP